MQMRGLIASPSYDTNLHPETNSWLCNCPQIQKGTEKCTSVVHTLCTCSNKEFKNPNQFALNQSITLHLIWQKVIFNQFYL
jgi:hypothetical protein